MSDMNAHSASATPTQPAEVLYRTYATVGQDHPSFVRMNITHDNHDYDPNVDYTTTTVTLRNSRSQQNEIIASHEDIIEPRLYRTYAIGYQHSSPSSLFSLLQRDEEVATDDEGDEEEHMGHPDAPGPYRPEEEEDLYAPSEESIPPKNPLHHCYTYGNQPNILGIEATHYIPNYENGMTVHYYRDETTGQLTAIRNPDGTPAQPRRDESELPDALQTRLLPAFSVRPPTVASPPRFIPLDEYMARFGRPSPPPNGGAAAANPNIRLTDHEYEEYYHGCSHFKSSMV